jgi:ribonuclease P protein component
MQLVTIKRRSHFLRVRGGARWACASFALEARDRPVPESEGGARFGFTVTRKLGNAVVRNRVKRRLREAVRHCASPYIRPGSDYVLIARDAALKRRFSDLLGDLETALQRVHAKGPPRSRAAPDSGSASKPKRPEPSNADAPSRPPNHRTPAPD